MWIVVRVCYYAARIAVNTEQIYLFSKAPHTTNLYGRHYACSLSCLKVASLVPAPRICVSSSFIHRQETENYLYMRHNDVSWKRIFSFFHSQVKNLRIWNERKIFRWDFINLEWSNFLQSTSNSLSYFTQQHRIRNDLKLEVMAKWDA